VATILSLTSLVLGYWGHETGRAWQTMLFVGLISLQLGVALGLRPRLLTAENPLFLVAVAGSFLLAAAGVYVPVLQPFLGTVPLPPGDLVASAAAAVVGWAAVRSTGRREHHRAPRRHVR
jgi:Ca2+-transporting ATPase